MMNHCIPIRALKDNYIWMFYHPQTKRAWVVDPGDAEPVIATCEQLNVVLAGILVTHHHADHTGGIADLLHYAKHIPVYGSKISKNHYINYPIQDKDKIILDDYHFEVIAIPGHTLDHVAYYGESSLFCGDTLFSVGCGKVFEGTMQQMLNALTRLSELPDDTKIYCGHEYTLANLYFAATVDPNNLLIQEKLNYVKLMQKNNACTLPSTLLIEKQINPFLRCYVVEIKESVEKHYKKTLANTLEVFTHLREWKNNFFIIP